MYKIIINDIAEIEINGFQQDIRKNDMKDVISELTANLKEKLESPTEIDDFLPYFSDNSISNIKIQDDEKVIFDSDMYSEIFSINYYKHATEDAFENNGQIIFMKVIKFNVDNNEE